MEEEDDCVKEEKGKTIDIGREEEDNQEDLQRKFISYITKYANWKFSIYKIKTQFNKIKFSLVFIPSN